jgi:TRAP-type mannitol/chloroaromatic compound transport system permease large subunit
MLDLFAHNLAPIMFIIVMSMLLLGYPVAFTLAAGGIYFFIFGVELSHISPEIRLSWPLAQANMNRVFDIMRNDTLLAIPFFTFMGLILERSRMAEDLLDTVGQLFGTVRGGLAFAVVIVGALLAATTGVVAASVIAMGLISLPIMMRYNYNPGLAAGTIAASGTLAQVVPPSLVLIVMADQLGRSVGDMYVGAIVPAMMLIGLYCLYIFAVTLIKPQWVPALPPEARPLGSGGFSLYLIMLAAIVLYVAAYFLIFTDFRYETRVVWSALLATVIPYLFAIANRRLQLGYLSRMAEQVVIVLIPPLALIFLVLGTIFLGIATPTEGGAMGAAGALAMAAAKGRLNYKVLSQALDATAKLATFVMFILIGARVFALTFYGISGDVWVKDLMLALPGGQTGFLIVVTIIVFILGCFLDFFEIAFVLIPLLVPVAEQLGIDLIWFGVLIGFNLQVGFLTPPFGFALFYLRSVAPIKAWYDKTTDRMIPPITTKSIYLGTFPFIVLNVLLLGILIAFPGLVTHYKSEPVLMNPGDINTQINNSGASGLGLDGELGLPGAPSIGLPGPGDGMPAMPNFGTPATPSTTPPAEGTTLPAPGGLPGPGDAGGLPRFD